MNDKGYSIGGVLMAGDTGQIRARIISRLVRSMYGPGILNNAHRGDFVEMMVAEALGGSWRFCGLGWHPWDFEKHIGTARMRIQVRHAAAQQLWGVTKGMRLHFGWKKQPPDYFKKDSPGIVIEESGRFCELFVFGLHEMVGPGVDQTNPSQWRFFVIPEADLPPGVKSIGLSKAKKCWDVCTFDELGGKVEGKVRHILARN